MRRAAGRSNDLYIMRAWMAPQACSIRRFHEEACRVPMAPDPDIGERYARSAVPTSARTTSNMAP